MSMQARLISTLVTTAICIGISIYQDEKKKNAVAFLERKRVAFNFLCEQHADAVRQGHQYRAAAISKELSVRRAEYNDLAAQARRLNII